MLYTSRNKNQKKMPGCKFSSKTRRCRKSNKISGNDSECRSKRKHSGKRVCVKTAAAKKQHPVKLAPGMRSFRTRRSETPRSAARAAAARSGERKRNPLALPTLDMYLPLSKFESIHSECL